jgi:hypothetical protein
MRIAVSLPYINLLLDVGDLSDPIAKYAKRRGRVSHGYLNKFLRNSPKLEAVNIKSTQPLQTEE